MRRVDLYIARLRTLQTSKDNDQIKRPRPPTGPLDTKYGLLSKDREVRDRERERLALEMHTGYVPPLQEKCVRTPRPITLVLGRFGLTDQKSVGFTERLRSCPVVSSLKDQKFPLVHIYCPR